MTAGGCLKTVILSRVDGEGPPAVHDMRTATTTSAPVILSLRRISKSDGRSHRERFRVGTVVAF
jgi:hypothetical protein